MAKSGFDKLIDLIKRYRYFLWGGGIVFLCSLGGALYLYSKYTGVLSTKIADFLIGVAQTILSTVLIGGGLGVVFNFIVEEQKKEEEAVKERLKRMQESKEQRKIFRQEIRRRLQKVHDDVELARVLIKSHRSGRTYGEQIRELIMPSNIALQDIKRQLQEIKEESPIQYLLELRVSLTYMSAYLSVLIEEFAQHYLNIANLQNYQDTLADRRREVYSELLVNTDKVSDQKEAIRDFVESTNTLMQDKSVPDRMHVVWDAMKQLDYVWDFIDDLRNDKGSASKYQTFFMDHHFHCFRLLRDKDSHVNEKICRRKSFQNYLQEVERLGVKKESDQPITRNDSLTRMIMIEELRFDFETMSRAKA